MIRIASIADFIPDSETHRATDAALSHSAKLLGANLQHQWIATDGLSLDVFKSFDGVLVGTGSPYQNKQNVLDAIHYARTNDFPILATCGGFQHAILEIAQNELGIEDAEHAEYNPTTKSGVIVPLSCSLRGREMRISLTENSLAANLYGATEVTEKYYCSFGVNPEYVSRLKTSSLRITGSDPEGEMRVIEIPGHRFFLATLFVPQAQSRPEAPHPIVSGFLRACGIGTDERNRLLVVSDPQKCLDRVPLPRR